MRKSYNITTPVTKWNYQVTRAEEIPGALARAFYIARSGRPGPVLIDITRNAQLQPFHFVPYVPCTHIRSYRPVPIVRPEYVHEAAVLLNQAQRPFVPWGQRVEAREDLRPALRQMLARPGSFLLEVLVAKENNIFPMVPQGCSVAEIRLRWSDNSPSVIQRMLRMQQRRTILPATITANSKLLYMLAARQPHGTLLGHNPLSDGAKVYTQV